MCINESTTIITLGVIFILFDDIWPEDTGISESYTENHSLLPQGSQRTYIHKEVRIKVLLSYLMCPCPKSYSAEFW